MKKRTLRTIIMSLGVATAGHAQLSITTLDSPVVIDFEDTMAGVANGQFTGTGFKPAPDSGQLDSAAFAVTGLSSGALAYGGTAVTGDAARGTSNAGAGANFGGVYAIHNLGSTGNSGIGFRPTSTSLLNGSMTLRLANDTGTILTRMDLGYDVFALNDNGRSTRIGISYSLDNLSFTSLPALDYATPAAADASPAWLVAGRSVTLEGLSLDPGASFYVRWSLADNGGSSARDLVALDNLTVTAVPEPGSGWLLALGLASLGWFRRCRGPAA